MTERVFVERGIKPVLYTVAAALFALTGIWLLVERLSQGGGEWMMLALNVAWVLVFGFGVFYYLKTALWGLQGKISLKLDDEGLSITGPSGDRQIPWTQIRDINLKDSEIELTLHASRDEGEADADSSSMAGRLAQSLLSDRETLSWNYGTSRKELLRVLTACRDEAVSAGR